MIEWRGPTNILDQMIVAWRTIGSDYCCRVVIGLNRTINDVQSDFGRSSIGGVKAGSVLPIANFLTTVCRSGARRPDSCRFQSACHMSQEYLDDERTLSNCCEPSECLFAPLSRSHLNPSTLRSSTLIDAHICVFRHRRLEHQSRHLSPGEPSVQEPHKPILASVEMIFSQIRSEQRRHFPVLALVVGLYPILGS